MSDVIPVSVEWLTLREDADALRRWMLDPALRARLKAEAQRGRGLLPRWSETADRVSRTLGGVR